MPALETALSLATNAEEYLAVLLRKVDALDKHYSRPYARNRRFHLHCIRQSALRNFSNEVLSCRDDAVTSVIKNSMGRKLETLMWRRVPLPPPCDLYVIIPR